MIKNLHKYKHDISKQLKYSSVDLNVGGYTETQAIKVHIDHMPSLNVLSLYI